MNVLLIGSGGREHALAWKIAQSPLLETLFLAPGNGGTTDLGEVAIVNTADHGAVLSFCALMNIGLVVIGPEAPLVDGLADSLREAGVAVFGPSKEAAQLEGSKHFTKALCSRMNIPTASYQHFTEAEAARQHVKSQGAPVVIKADGLAAGKGVTVAMNIDEALAAIDDCFAGTFGAAGAEVVIEEFLEGEEASMFFICDGVRAISFGTAQDHKRVGDGDTGPNTGGMGAYSPAPVMSEDMQNQVFKAIVEPTLKGMADAGMPFRGVLYAGLMIDQGVAKLIEYNVRFGDPECQVLMMRLESDLLPILLASASGDLSKSDVRWNDDAALTVVMAANGYPGAYEKGTVINGLTGLNTDDVQIFHAGTERKGGGIVATGGRVLNVTARAQNVSAAQKLAYEAVDRIDWPDGFARRDIGWRAIERERD